MRAETPTVLTVAAILLLAPALAGCISGPTEVTDEVAQLRIGDRYNYTHDIFLSNDTEGRAFEFTGRSPITAPGLEGDCVWMNKTGAQIDPNASIPVCLDPGSLAIRADKTGPIYNHTAWGYRDTLEFWNGLMLPTADVVFGADRTEYVIDIPDQALPAKTVNVSWTVDGDRAILDGHLTWPEPRTPSTEDKPDRRVNWTAKYRADTPLPVEVGLTPCGATNWQTGDMELTPLGVGPDRGRDDVLPCPPTAVTLELAKYQPGDGAVIDQRRPDRGDWPGESTNRSTAPGDGSRSWTELLDPGRPYAGYDLEQAWQFAQTRDARLRVFLANASVTFPAGVTYDRINASDGSIYHIWRVALCKADGDCYMAQSGVRRLANGTGYPFVEFRTRYAPPDTHHRWWRGSFEGYPLPESVRAETLQAAMPMRDLAQRWEKMHPYEASVRGFYAQLVPGFLPEEAGPLWGYAAGFVHGGKWFDPPTEDAVEGYFSLIHLYAHFDGVTGAPSIFLEPLEPPPASWQTREPSFVEDAGPRPAGGCPVQVSGHPAVSRHPTLDGAVPGCPLLADMPSSDGGIPGLTPLLQRPV